MAHVVFWLNEETSLRNDSVPFLRWISSSLITAITAIILVNIKIMINIVYPSFDVAK